MTDENFLYRGIVDNRSAEKEEGLKTWNRLASGIEFEWIYQQEYSPKKGVGSDEVGDARHSTM